MAYTPQHSPVKKPASQSQEDLKTYEVIDDPMHDDEAEPSMSDEMQPAQDKLGMSPPVTQIKISESQVVVNDQEMDLDDAPQPAPISSQHRQQNRTPEPTQSRSQGVLVRPSPSSPGRLEPFDWEDFESRYQKALAGADHRESELLEEFENLVKYFKVWASASSSHDNERAVKRLQTRTRYVHLSEERLKQKKEHLSEVVKAFQSALALLSTAR